jgi:hypothetical protein
MVKKLIRVVPEAVWSPEQWSIEYEVISIW